jgi:transcriptional regulator with XRE-family HTH domain
MPAPRLLPDNDVLKKLRAQGWTYEDIANEYGVTKGAVYLRLRQAKATHDRPDYSHLIPWTIRVEHAHARPAQMLRMLGRRENNLPIPEAKERMLDRWLQEVKEANVVVDYDPDFPPNPANPKNGGWHYRRRKPEDGDGLVRKPVEHTADQ